MGIFNYQDQKRLDGLWEFGRLVRQSAVYSFAAKLSPTATLPAWWALYAVAFIPYVFEITFSTDTAIEWSLYQANGNPGASNVAGSGLDISSGASPEHQLAYVSAAPGVAALIDTGFCGAGQRINIIPRAIIRCRLNTPLVLATAAIAANCYACFKFLEMRD